jgi:chromosome segregation ATPase
MEINRIKKLLEQKDNDCNLLTTRLNMMEDRCKDLEEEMEMKSGENNRLRKQVTDIEAAMKDLYKSRKGQGTLQIEMESLKADNERLLALLKDTTEYADCEDNEILKSAATKTLVGVNGVTDAFAANRRARGTSADIGGKRV